MGVLRTHEIVLFNNCSSVIVKVLLSGSVVLMWGSNSEDITIMYALDHAVHDLHHLRSCLLLQIACCMHSTHAVTIT